MSTGNVGVAVGVCSGLLEGVRVAEREEYKLKSVGNSRGYGEAEGRGLLEASKKLESDLEFF